MCAYPGLVSHRLVQGEAMKQSEIMKKKTRFPALILFLCGFLAGNLIPNILWKIKWQQKTLASIYFLSIFADRKYFRYRIFKRTHKDPG